MGLKRGQNASIKKRRLPKKKRGKEYSHNQHPQRREERYPSKRKQLKWICKARTQREEKNESIANETDMRMESDRNSRGHVHTEAEDTQSRKPAWEWKMNKKKKKHTHNQKRKERYPSEQTQEKWSGNNRKMLTQRNRRMNRGKQGPSKHSRHRDGKRSTKPVHFKIVLLS